MTRWKAQHGLTIIEALVVLTLLVILAVMILPSLSGSRKAALPQCKNNQKQIGLAAFFYAEDSKRAFPNLDSLPGNDGPVALALLTNYLNRKTNLFMCPFVVKQREKERPWYRERFVPELNAAFFKSNGNDYAYYDGVMPGPATNAFLADRLAWTSRFVTNRALTNHVGGRINAAFADGHVENLRPDRILGTNLSPMWSATQDPVCRP